MTVRLLLYGALLATSASPQVGPPQPVQWKTALAPDRPVHPGTNAIIDVSAEVQQGWHVYALTEPAGGPIPLRISLEDNLVAQLRGAISGTDPIRINDSSFQMQTQLYRDNFTLKVPITVKNPPAGKQIIPLNVRFQACNDRTCLVPKTVHLSIPVEVVPGA